MPPSVSAPRPKLTIRLPTKQRRSRASQVAAVEPQYDFPSLPSNSHDRGSIPPQKASLRKRRLSGISAGGDDGPGDRQNAPADRPAVRQRLDSSSSTATVRPSKLAPIEDEDDEESNSSPTAAGSSTPLESDFYWENDCCPPTTATDPPQIASASQLFEAVPKSIRPRDLENKKPSLDRNASMSKSSRALKPTSLLSSSGRLPLKPIRNANSVVSTSVSQVHAAGIVQQPLAGRTANTTATVPKPTRASSQLSRYDLTLLPSIRHTDLWDIPQDGWLWWAGKMYLTDRELLACTRHPQPYIQGIEIECRSYGRDGRHARETPDNPAYTTQYKGARCPSAFTPKERDALLNPAAGIHMGKDWVVSSSVATTGHLDDGGWFIPIWVPLPAELFAKVETREFRIRAKGVVMDEDRWTRSIVVHSGVVNFTLSHLRTEREMGNLKGRAEDTVVKPSAESSLPKRRRRDSGVPSESSTSSESDGEEEQDEAPNLESEIEVF